MYIMRNVFFLGLVMAATAASGQSKDERVIRAILSEQVVAWNLGDIKGYMAGYWQNDALQFIGKSGVIYGFEKTLQQYREHYPDTAAMGKLSLGILRMQQLSTHYIFVTGKWQLYRTAGDLKGYFTLLFKKINKKWVIISDHSS